MSSLLISIWKDILLEMGKIGNDEQGMFMMM